MIRRNLLALAGLCAHNALLVAADSISDHALQLDLLGAAVATSQLLVFFYPASDWGRPRNLILGHTFSALVGFGLRALLPLCSPYLLAALAIPMAGLSMQVTRSLHPPAGVTATLLVLAPRRVPLHAVLIPLWFACIALVVLREMFDALAARWGGRTVRGKSETESD